MRIFANSILAGLFLFAVLPLVALAEDGEADDWGFVVEGSTQFPVFAGGGVRVETPWNLDLRGDVGVLPRSYGKLLNDTAQDFGAYDDATAFIIEEAFEDSLVLRVGSAWHVFGGGFYLGFGYAYVDLSGSVTDGEALSAALPGVPDLPRDFSGAVSIDTTLHMLQGELGYEWTIVESLVLRLGLGASFTVGGSVDFGVPAGLPPVLEAQALELERIGEDYLEGILTDYLHTITGTIALGYRF